MAESKPDGWYIVQQESGHCDIVMSAANPSPEMNAPDSSNAAENPKTWGPFDSQGEAIARRVGLIRSGRCKPV